MSQQLYVTPAIAVSQNSSVTETSNYGGATLHLNVYDQKGRPVTVQVTMSASSWTTTAFNGENNTSVTANGIQLCYYYYSYGQQSSFTPKVITSGDVSINLSYGDYFGYGGSSGLSLSYVIK